MSTDLKDFLNLSTEKMQNRALDGAHREHTNTSVELATVAKFLNPQLKSFLPLFQEPIAFLFKLKTNDHSGQFCSFLKHVKIELKAEQLT